MSEDTGEESGSTEDQTKSSVPGCMSVPELILAKTYWVIVLYDGVHYAREVTEVHESTKDVKVSVMHKSGAYWKWPRKAVSFFISRRTSLERSVLLL